MYSFKILKKDALAVEKVTTDDSNIYRFYIVGRGYVGAVHLPKGDEADGPFKNLVHVAWHVMDSEDRDIEDWETVRLQTTPREIRGEIATGIWGDVQMGYCITTMELVPLEWLLERLSYVYRKQTH